MSLYIPLFKALNEADVQYVIVGGLATVLHGYARFTADVDLVINLAQEETEKVITVLTALGMKPRLPVDPMQFTDPEKRKSWTEDKNMLVFSMYQPDNPLLVIDLFVNEPVPYPQLAQRAVQLELGGETVPVCAINDLIEMKQKAGRPKDLEDIKYLKALLENDDG